MRFLFMVTFRGCIAKNVCMLQNKENSNALRGFCL
ncbi:hypothetical protein PEC302107_33900 [Pectobacterium araliae]|nr:hypothetical protein PEC302107_33900 [Pectobacterium carotovorum subsp. carotovorum]